MNKTIENALKIVEDLIVYFQTGDNKNRIIHGNLLIVKENIQKIQNNLKEKIWDKRREIRDLKEALLEAENTIKSIKEVK